MKMKFERVHLWVVFTKAFQFLNRYVKIMIRGVHIWGAENWDLLYASVLFTGVGRS